MQNHRFCHGLFSSLCACASHHRFQKYGGLHEERTAEHWLKASEKAKTKTRTTATRLQETPEKRKMLEKDREARRNDSGLTQSKFVDILFALNPCVFIFTVNSGVSLYFVHGRLSFYYFKILMNFTCERIRANVGIIRNLCG